MSFKPFYIHKQREIFKEDPAAVRCLPRGFTAFVSPSPDPKNCFVQVTFCSSKDQFCKATGRALAVNSAVVEVNKRNLGQELAKYMCKVHGYLTPKSFYYCFDYVYKHLL